MRGFAYYNLVRLFQSVPLVIEQSTPKNYFPKKSTEEEGWALVFSDYQEALKIGLPDPAPSFVDNRLNTGVVHALLARAYLLRTRPGSQAYWDKVKEHTQAVEQLGVYDLEPYNEFGEIFVYTKGDRWVKNTEMIWAIGQMYGIGYGGILGHNDESALGTAATMPNGKYTYTFVDKDSTVYIPASGGQFTGAARYAVSEQFADLMLEYDALGDKRIREMLYYPTYTEYSQIKKNKFKIVAENVINAAENYQSLKETNGTDGEYLHIRKYRVRQIHDVNVWDGGWFHSLMFPLIRYADVLLMRAEAEYH
ncbi:MAG: RagB/SusD family nutrient uptake outer membrane protein [Bacteroidales bacterium]|nr:RagB/SusD family nutrient uptake outer membrane protein [Bacteroidales bacterium]